MKYLTKYSHYQMYVLFIRLMGISVKRKHDFVEEITDMKGPKYIYSNNGIMIYCSCVMHEQ